MNLKVSISNHLQAITGDKESNYQRAVPTSIILAPFSEVSFSDLIVNVKYV